jgi:antitoxin (DNA-binding transcriptional repressor) of toxin-antitoxin stability system
MRFGPDKHCGIMKKIEITKACAPVSEYARKAKRDPIVVMKKGKPIAAVVPVPNADTETVFLSTSDKFLAIIERSRSRHKKEGGISSSEIRRRLRLK